MAGGLVTMTIVRVFPSGSLAVCVFGCRRRLETAGVVVDSCIDDFVTSVPVLLQSVVVLLS